MHFLKCIFLLKMHFATKFFLAHMKFKSKICHLVKELPFYISKWLSSCHLKWWQYLKCSGRSNNFVIISKEPFFQLIYQNLAASLEAFLKNASSDAARFWYINWKNGSFEIMTFYNIFNIYKFTIFPFL